MKTIYKANIHYMTELFIDNDKDKGCDPNSLQDCGICDTITKSTLEELVKHLDYFEGIEHFEDNRYETGYEETQRDGTHVCVMVSIYITKQEIKETEIDKPDLFNTAA